MEMLSESEENNRFVYIIRKILSLDVNVELDYVKHAQNSIKKYVLRDVKRGL